MQGLCQDKQINSWRAGSRVRKLPGDSEGAGACKRTWRTRAWKKGTRGDAAFSPESEAKSPPLEAKTPETKLAELHPDARLAYRPGARCESAVGKVRAAEVSQVGKHEEGVADVRGGLEESTILPPPENWETKAEPKRYSSRVPGTSKDRTVPLGGSGGETQRGAGISKFLFLNR